MDYTSRTSEFEEGAELSEDQRTAPRYISLIRAAKLTGGKGEFVCVIRDVSRSGIGVKTFHPLPKSETRPTLELQNGDTYRLERVRYDAKEASFTFGDNVEVEKLIKEEWRFPRRQLRLGIFMPVSISSQTERFEATVLNLSQQGAQIECDRILARDQRIRLEGAELREINATVRWRNEGCYGLAFEDTFSLSQFAKMAAKLQCPELLSGTMDG